MDNNIEATQGTGVDDWSGAYEVKGTDVVDSFIDKEIKGDWKSDVARDMPKLLKELESNLPFTVMIVSIIGYISIASFGQMDSTGKYFGYLFFLILMFFGYKSLKENALITFFKNLFGKKKNKLLLVLLLLSLIFICFQNFDSILWLWNCTKPVLKIK